jgi:hypothetical protein
VIDLLVTRPRDADGAASGEDAPPRRLLPAPRRGERGAELSFLLGWHVAELFYLSEDGGSTSAGAGQPSYTSGQPRFMTALDDLSAAQKAQLLAAKIRTDARALTDHLRDTNRAADITALTRSTDGEATLIEFPAYRPGSQEFREAVATRDVQILLMLQAADTSLGKSYALARDLAAVMLNPPDLTIGIIRDQQRLGRLHAALDDLKSQFAQWTVDAVHRNLADWQEWAVASRRGRQPSTPAADTLLRQAEIWRAMLSGEKAPADFLRPRDYLDANKKMLLEFAREVRQAIVANRQVVAVVAVMTLVAVTAIVAAFMTGISLFVGGAFIAMLGLVGITGSRALAKLREVQEQLRSMLQVPALEAELIQSVAHATSQVPRP